MSPAKKLLSSLLKSLLKAPEKNQPSIDEIKNVLIVRQHNQLGDMLLSVPLFRIIKENIEGVKIHLVASKENYEAVKQNPLLDKVLLFDKKSFRNPLNMFRFFSELRKTNYDLALVPTTVSVSFTSSLIARLSKSRYRIGPASLNEKEFPYKYMFNKSIDYDHKKMTDLHISEVILKCVDDFNFRITEFKSMLGIKKENREYAEKFFENTDKLKIGMHTGAGKILNRWDIDNFILLVEMLEEKYHPFFYFTIGEWEDEIVKKIRERLKTNYKILTTGIHNIAAIVENSDLFISNDTGIMHVAGTTETPLICLFGPTEPANWAPIGKNIIIIRVNEDINSITPLMVFEKASSVLDAKK